MELEGQTTKKTYIVLLVEILQKKKQILNELMQMTMKQRDIISAEKVDDEEFLHMVSMKEEQIANLNNLDDGFDKLYQSVKDELITGKEKYISAINSLKELIAQITDLSVNLQALERRNKSQIDLYFSTMRNKIKNSRISNRTVSNYYKTMTKQHEIQSFFYDKKN